MIAAGSVMSAGVRVFVGAERENRFALPEAGFMLHESVQTLEGRTTDILIDAHNLAERRERWRQMMSEATGQPIERIVADTARDFYLDAQAACDYGLCGRVITSVGELA